MTQAIQSVYEVPGLYKRLEAHMNHYDAIDAPTPMSRGYAMGASCTAAELLEYYGDNLHEDLIKELRTYKANRIESIYIHDEEKRVETKAYAAGAIATIEFVIDEIDNL